MEKLTLADKVAEATKSARQRFETLQRIQSEETHILKTLVDMGPKPEGMDIDPQNEREWRIYYSAILGCYGNLKMWLNDTY